MAIGDVFFSQKANRYYQEGRRGSVSNDQGVKSLLYDEGTGQFIDTRGRTVPLETITRQTFRSRDLVAYDTEGRPFISSTVRSKVISELEAAKGPLAGNQDVMIRTVVTTPDGATHVFYYPGKLGQNVDPDVIKEQAAKDARSKLIDGRNSTGRNYDISTNEIRNRTSSSQYIQRTTTIR